MAPVIIAKDLYKCYPGFPPVLRGVSIDVMPGEMVAIMGPSGCGKSTMLHILGMLHAPDSGQLEILDVNVLKLDSDAVSAFRRENMGFVMQASNLFEHSTVFENVEFPLIYENVPPQERWERVIRALELVRLSSRVHYRSNRLSGGEQQRVAIARAMVNNPRILLADEPTGALDSRTSAVIMENFRSLCHNGGVAMVMVTHDPKMAEYCDSIYTLDEGMLHCRKHEPPNVSAGSSKDFLKPPEPVVRSALVAWRFPTPQNHNVLELARRMHGQRLLARIYALSRTGVFSGQGGYSLPLPVRQMGFWQRLFGNRILCANSRCKTTVHELWRMLPAKQGFRRCFWRMRAFSCGSILARWCGIDNIEFLYSAGARKVAASVWVAARLLDIPFAFAIRPEDVPLLGVDCRVRAKEAAFITCSTPAIAEAFQKFAPDIPQEKILIMPNLPRYASAEEEPEAALPPVPGKPTDILALSPQSAPASFAKFIHAAHLLRKKGFNFRISVLGRSGIGLRLRLLFSSLRGIVNFTDGAADDRQAEKFRGADVFVAWPPQQPGMELALPWPVCEAMCFGLPIASLGISQGMVPLKADENCLLATNSDELAGAITKIIGEKELAERLGERAKLDIRAFLDLSGVTASFTKRIVEAAALADRGKNRADRKRNGL